MFLRLPTSSFSWAWCSVLHRLSFLTSYRRHIASAGKPSRGLNGEVFYSLSRRIWFDFIFGMCWEWCLTTGSWVKAFFLLELWMLLCNIVVNVDRYNVCTGCCVGWESRGQRWNGGALCNAATKETQFRCRESSITILPPPPLSPHANTHSLVHADARTCLLNLHSQTHLLPRFLCMQTPTSLSCSVVLPSILYSFSIFWTFTVMFSPCFHFVLQGEEAAYQ